MECVHCSAPTIHRQTEQLLLFKLIILVNKAAASEYCQLCQKKFGEVLGFLPVGLYVLTWGVGGLYLPPLAFSQVLEFMRRRRVLFLLRLVLPK